MSTLAASIQTNRKQWMWAVGLAGFILLWLALATLTLRRSQITTNVPTPLSQMRLQQTELASRLSQSPPSAPLAAPMANNATRDIAASVEQIASSSAFDQRMMIRTSSLDLIVAHPAETAAQIEQVAERLGGYLESSSGSSVDANGWAMTIRVPAARFDQMRTEIRKLGLRVENEKVISEDVTRQYVDQEAILRNLHAEEAQYLTILKRANTVKDMLAVTQQLSTVRGQIERQQAEFNALSKQVETVAITVSLRAEAQTEAFGLHWRPLYQLKVALRDGLESLASYISFMVSLLFYLPAVILWAGTILGSIFAGWKVIGWIGRRWFGWQKQPASSAQQA